MAAVLFPPKISGYVLCAAGKRDCDEAVAFEAALFADAVDLRLVDGSLASLKAQLDGAQRAVIVALKVLKATRLADLLRTFANELAKDFISEDALDSLCEATESSDSENELDIDMILLMALVGNDKLELTRDGMNIAKVKCPELVGGFRKLFWGPEPFVDGLTSDMSGRLSGIVAEGQRIRAASSGGASSSSGRARSPGDATELTTPLPVCREAISSFASSKDSNESCARSVLSIVTARDDGLCRYIVEEAEGGEEDPCLRQRTFTDLWKTLAVNDLVTLARGEPGSDVLWPREIGQVVQDRRCGSCPFQVRGPRGKTAWYPGEALIVAPRKRSGSVSIKNRKPLEQLVLEALDPQTTLDFPKVTDICELAARHPDTADMSMAVLVATLGDQKVKTGDSRNISQDYVKVLTIFNEMLYEDRLVDVLRRTTGLQPALERLRQYRQGNLGSANDENIRMLSNEIEKRVFFGAPAGSAGRPTPRTEIIAFCPQGHLLVWQGGQGRFHLFSRYCALCNKHLHRTVERYRCHSCRYYVVCVSCVRWGAPPPTGTSTPAPQPSQIDSLSDFLGEPLHSCASAP